MPDVMPSGSVQSGPVRRVGERRSGVDWYNRVDMMYDV